MIRLYENSDTPAVYYLLGVIFRLAIFRNDFLDKVINLFLNFASMRDSRDDYIFIENVCGYVIDTQHQLTRNNTFFYLSLGTSIYIKLVLRCLYNFFPN